MSLSTAAEAKVAAAVAPVDTLLAPVCTALLLVAVSGTLLLALVGTVSPLIATPVVVPVALKLPTNVVEAVCVIVKFPVTVFAAPSGIVA